jgi:hypothetical protein
MKVFFVFLLPLLCQSFDPRSVANQKTDTRELTTDLRSEANQQTDTRELTDLSSEANQ